MKKSFIFSLILFVSHALNAASMTEAVTKTKATFIANVIQLMPESVVSPRDLSDVGIFHYQDGFFALRAGKANLIQRYNMDEQLRGMSTESLKSFLQDGYVTLTQSSNGDYNLRAQGRLRGGGALGAHIAYWTVKSLCWGIVGGAATVATSAAISTGAAAIGAAAGASTLTTATAAGAAKGVALGVVGKVGAIGTLGAKGVAGAITANAIAGGTAGVVATEVTVSTAAAVGGSAGLVAFIEGLSLGAAGLFGVMSGPV